MEEKTTGQYNVKNLINYMINKKIIREFTNNGEDRWSNFSKGGKTAEPAPENAYAEALIKDLTTLQNRKEPIKLADVHSVLKEHKKKLNTKKHILNSAFVKLINTLYQKAKNALREEQHISELFHKQLGKEAADRFLSEQDYVAFFKKNKDSPPEQRPEDSHIHSPLTKSITNPYVPTIPWRQWRPLFPSNPRS